MLNYEVYLEFDRTDILINRINWFNGYNKLFTNYDYDKF